MAGQLTIDTLKASTGVLATQNGMTGIAKAWAQYSVANGGPLTVNNSFNISSITRVAQGTLQVAFTTAMKNTGYVVAGGSSSGSNNSVYGSLFSAFVNPPAGSPYNAPPTTSGFYAATYYSPGTATPIDPFYASFVVFGS